MPETLELETRESPVAEAAVGPAPDAVPVPESEPVEKPKRKRKADAGKAEKPKPKRIPQGKAPQETIDERKLAAGFAAFADVIHRVLAVRAGEHWLLSPEESAIIGESMATIVTTLFETVNPKLVAVAMAGVQITAIEVAHMLAAPPKPQAQAPRPAPANGLAYVPPTGEPVGQPII
jgi:hypothetical protein